MIQGSVEIPITLQNLVQVTQLLIAASATAETKINDENIAELNNSLNVLVVYYKGLVTAATASQNT